MQPKRVLQTASAAVLSLVIASSSFAALCVWRKPDQDIKPVAGAEKSSETVAFSVRKLVHVYDVLN